VFTRCLHRRRSTRNVKGWPRNVNGWSAKAPDGPASQNS